MSDPKRYVLVVGDVMLDRRIEGPATRISPEAPSPVVVQEEVTESPGGAANVAANLAALGANVRLIGTVGDDYEATALNTLLTTKYNVAVCLVPVAGTPTTVKTRITSGGQQMLRVDRECESLDNTPGMLAGLQGVLPTVTAGADTVLIVISDYAKGAMSPTVIAYLLDWAKCAGIPVFVDAKPETLLSYAGATLVSPNLAEARAVVDAAGHVHPALYGGNVQDEIDVCTVFLHRHFPMAVVTCGERGATYCSADAPSAITVDTVPQHVADVTGAGDTFMAALAVGCLNGWPLETSIRAANVAAGLAVREYGVTVIQKGDWDDALREQAGWAGKLLTLDEAVVLANRYRDRGDRIVLANGCFDGLHAGHLALLQFAKGYGVLFAAYNDDESVRQLKGDTRPILPAAKRAEHLAMFSAVDVAICFDGNVNHLVHRLKPDVLVKGAEYQSSKVPGADYVADHGGCVAFAPMQPSLSTTEIVARNASGH